MLRKILAIILLLNHLNTYMFIPQMAEVDSYDRAGNQVDDVNTLVEYIDQEIMGHHDNTPEDEDDDSGQPYHIIKLQEHSWHPYVVTIQTKVTFSDKPAKVFTGYIEHKPTPGFPHSLLQPPQEAASYKLHAAS
jgi:hypothetical protein